MIAAITKRMRRLTYWQWAMIGSAVLFVWCAAESWRFHRSAMAVRKWVLDPDSSIGLEPVGPEWLHSRLPIWVCQYYFSVPDYAWVFESKGADELLQELRYLPTIRMLKLIGFHENPATAVAKAKWNDRLACVGGLRHLHELSLSDLPISDADLHHLSRLTDLRELDLDNTGVSGQGLVALSDLPQLSVLSLCHTPVTDAAIPHLIRIQNLKQLDLHGSDVTESGCNEFAHARPDVRLKWP